MSRIRFVGLDPDSYWPADVDEHRRTRERVRGLAELSPEAQAYDVAHAVRNGSLSQSHGDADDRGRDEGLSGAVMLALSLAAGLLALAVAYLGMLASG